MPAVMNLPDLDLLNKILDYNKDTGEFTWLPRTVDMFPDERTFNSWTAQFCGKPAGSSYLHSDGRHYHEICYQKVKYRAHRIAWKMHYGEEPPPILDHIDNNGLNNSISNLRAATVTQNGWNAKKSSRNQSGYKGVSFNKEKNKWRAAIHVNKKTKLIGYFSSPEEASIAYQKESAALHGEFYNPT